jgi:hypothetical protein
MHDINDNFCPSLFGWVCHYQLFLILLFSRFNSDRALDYPQRQPAGKQYPGLWR